jgi:hypothetical protein
MIYAKIPYNTHGPDQSLSAVNVGLRYHERVMSRCLLIVESQKPSDVRHGADNIHGSGYDIYYIEIRWRWLIAFQSYS